MGVFAKKDLAIISRTLLNQCGNDCDHVTYWNRGEHVFWLHVFLEWARSSGVVLLNIRARKL